MANFISQLPNQGSLYESALSLVPPITPADACNSTTKSARNLHEKRDDPKVEACRLCPRLGKPPNLARQIHALTAAGCNPIYSEKHTGKTTKNRPQLARAIAQLTKGDVFVVAEWDRATRSMMDGLALMTQIHAKGATIKVLDRASLDLTTPTGRGVLGLLSAIYEEERARIVTRAKQGLDHARCIGVKFGRKPKLTASEAASALDMLRNGKSRRKVAAAFSVHPNTIALLANRAAA